MKKYLLALLALLLPFAAEAATTPNTFTAPITPNMVVSQFTSSSSAGTYVTVYTAGANGDVLNAIEVSTNDNTATAHVFTCGIFASTTQYVSTSFTLVKPATNTYIGTTTNVLSTTNWPGLPVDQNGNPYLMIPANDTVQCTFATAITASDFIQVDAFGGSY
jgi:hypothetical protein